jgi:hypothetical protein
MAFQIGKDFILRLNEPLKVLFKFEAMGVLPDVLKIMPSLPEGLPLIMI